VLLAVLWTSDFLYRIIVRPWLGSCERAACIYCVTRYKLLFLLHNTLEIRFNSIGCCTTLWLHNRKCLSSHRNNSTVVILSTAKLVTISLVSVDFDVASGLLFVGRLLGQLLYRRIRNVPHSVVFISEIRKNIEMPECIGTLGERVF